MNTNDIKQMLGNAARPNIPNKLQQLRELMEKHTKLLSKRMLECMFSDTPLQRELDKLNADIQGLLKSMRTE